MAKISRRPDRQQVLAAHKEYKKLQKELRRQQKASGVVVRPHATIANHISPYQDEEQERAARNESVLEQVKIFRTQMPTLLKRLSKIKDPRNPKSSKHKLTVLMLYGILSFAFQMSSRREANREMTRPMFVANLKELFPELESIPHHDTLMRLLVRIDVNELGSAHVEILKRFIRNKKFYRYLIAEHYPIAIDGTQKFARDTPFSEQWLDREVGPKDGTCFQYYVYVLEANLAFSNGMSIPLMSEFLGNEQSDHNQSKQDCELKGFKRLAARLKKEFPRLPILVLLDGLYPNGPLMELCLKYNWQFMIVLQDGSLKSVWEEFEGLGKLQTNNKASMQWGGRRQQFSWVNGIVYYYEPNDRKSVRINVVSCDETWEEIDDKTTRRIFKRSKHAWISSVAITKKNLHERCNLAARHRWGIESGFLVEKHHGYQYEKCLAQDWNAMRGYHYLMRIGHMFNVLAQYAEHLVLLVKSLGVRGMISFIRTTIAAPWLDLKLIQRELAAPYQLRLL
jgi:hypothetical protein